MEHTKGPWKANAILHGRIVGDFTIKNAEKYQINNHNATIATVYRPHDASLIAAAPELLSALRGMLEMVSAVLTEEQLSFPQCGTTIRNAINPAMDAIARAEERG